MTKVAAGSLLRTIFSRADAGACWIAVKVGFTAPACGAVGGFLECDILQTRNVCFWPKADMSECTAHVCFQGYSRHGVFTGLPPRSSVLADTLSDSWSLLNGRV